jgi:hypothetical protein
MPNQKPSMWLKYGVDSDNNLVTIEDVKSGKTDLICPYCGGLLIAKKGKIKAHHFAHTDETCYPVAKSQVPILPLYDNFNIQLSGKELLLLKQMWREYRNTEYVIPVVPFRLVLRKIFERHNQLEGYSFTSLGKIPVGGLPLAQFNEVQEPLLLQELAQLAGIAERAQLLNSSSLQTKLADLRVYRAQLRRLLKLSLYFLEIRADGKSLHKIGVSQRSIEERVAEVRRDLQKHYQRVDIRVLGTWQHRGNVELYFKHRYQQYNYKIETLTEYFRFKDVQLVLEDLCQMKPKTLNAEELQVLQEP